MEWNNMYSISREPTMEQITEYVGSRFWQELCDIIKTNYSVQPKIEYSKCSMLPGWNVKYKKGSKAICTLYPKEGYFTCMVTIGSKNLTEIEYLVPTCEEHVQDVFAKTDTFNGSKWLMIDVTSKKIFSNVLKIIELKMRK